MGSTAAARLPWLQARSRPCKGKRERFKKAMSLVAEIVARDPDIVHSSCLRLPALLDSDPREKARAMRKLSAIAAEARSRAIRARDQIATVSAASGARARTGRSLSGGPAARSWPPAAARVGVARERAGPFQICLPPRGRPSQQCA